MKITKIAIMFVIILFPFYIINQIHTTAQKRTLYTEMQYDSAINTAVDDAALSLLFNEKQEYESKYESVKNVRLNLKEGIGAFYRTLYANFNIAEDTTAQSMLDFYIPVVAMIGYDGYYLYTDDEYVNADGEHELRHVWSAKRPYAYQDEFGNSISFTLDDYVVAYERASDQWINGLRSEIGGTSTVPLLQQSDLFEQIRRITIVNAIQNDLAYYINRHNMIVKRYGVAYSFTLPTISQEEWNNSINDVGIMAFVQGIPIGDKHYNNYALGGARVMKKPLYSGMIANGVKYYYRGTSCTSSRPTLETFTTEKAAASEGYFPVSCDNSL